MNQFAIHAEGELTEQQQKVFDKAKSSMGMVPNLIAGLSESPEAAEAYMSLSHFFVKSSLTPEQRHVVWFTANAEHNCTYCMAGHTGIAMMDRIDNKIIETARKVESYEDPQLEALRKFTLAMIRQRGWLDDEEVQAFLDAGFTKRNVFDVLIGIAHKTISNYANHLMATPLDSFSEGFVWEKGKG